MMVLAGALKIEKEIQHPVEMAVARQTWWLVDYVTPYFYSGQ